MAMKKQMQTLFAYHWHTTRRLLAAAAQLQPGDDATHPDYGHGSIHDILFHILRTDRGWRAALETGRQSAGLGPEDFPDLAALERGFTEEEKAWDALFAQWSDAQIGEEVQLTNWRGDVLSTPLWRPLQHLALHGMQHHSELAQMLTVRGQSPGDLDFIFFRR